MRDVRNVRTQLCVVASTSHVPQVPHVACVSTRARPRESLQESCGVRKVREGGAEQ